jgi:hypothetical protein
MSKDLSIWEGKNEKSQKVLKAPKWSKHLTLFGKKVNSLKWSKWQKRPKDQKTIPILGKNENYQRD